MSDIKDLMLKAFLEVVSKEGAASVTLQKVAKTAHVPFATAHYHFGKDPMALTMAALAVVGERAQRHIEGVLVKPPKYLSRVKNPLELYVRGTFEWAFDNRSDASFWIYQYHLLTFHADLKEKQNIFIETAHSRIRKLIYEAAGMGFYQKIKVDDELASKIHFNLTGALIIALTIPQITAHKQYSDRCWDSIQTLLGK